MQPTSLPKPSFRPNKWPYKNKNGDTTTSKSKYQSFTNAPGWTYNPPLNEEIDSAMMTHFTVTPVKNKDQVYTLFKSGLTRLNVVLVLRYN